MHLYFKARCSPTIFLSEVSNVSEDTYFQALLRWFIFSFLMCQTNPMVENNDKRSLSAVPFLSL